MPEAKQRLRHSSDDEPGYSRKRKGRYWAYFDEDGKRVANRETIDEPSVSFTDASTPNPSLRQLW